MLDIPPKLTPEELHERTLKLLENIIPSLEKDMHPSVWMVISAVILKQALICFSDPEERLEEFFKEIRKSLVRV